MTYQVGLLLDFKEDDPTYDDLDTAQQAALRWAECEIEPAIGIWTGQDDGSELVAIVYQRGLFTK